MISLNSSPAVNALLLGQPRAHCNREKIPGDEIVTRQNPT